MIKRGLTRSRWDLPDFFREVEISHHTEKSWKAGYFQSVHKGQEFVIENSEDVEKWVVELIKEDL